MPKTPLTVLRVTLPQNSPAIILIVDVPFLKSLLCLSNPTLLGNRLKKKQQKQPPPKKKPLFWYQNDIPTETWQIH